MMTTTKTSYLPYVNLVAFFATLIMNILANLLPLGGKNTGELSDAYPNLFVPNGYIFSIWFVIYVLLGIYAFYQVTASQRDSPYQNKIGILFLLATIANISWLFFWHYEIVPLSLVAMVGLFLSLLGIYLRLEVGVSTASSSERRYVHLPFSVYIGWITVATVANVVALLVSISWDRFGLSENLWTILILAVVGLITFLVLLTRRDTAYSLVIAWALSGIYTKQIVAAPDVAITALALAVILLIVGIGVLVYPRIKSTK